MVAETGLKWQDDGDPVLLQVSIMYKFPTFLLILLLSLHPCALRAQTAKDSVTSHNGSLLFYAARLPTWRK